MVTHIVIFTWVEEVAADALDSLRAALDKLAADMAALATIRHGADLGFRGGNGDYALLATFADRAGWDAYQADPRHVAFVRDHVVPLQASRMAIQF